MNSNEILLLGLKKRVTAISKVDGSELWSTELSGHAGGGFVTLLCDGFLVFAYTGGHLYCLELASGSVLWRNELPGYGYGMATLALTDGRSAPDPAVVKLIMDQDAASTTAATSGATTS